MVLRTRVKTSQLAKKKMKQQYRGKKKDNYKKKKIIQEECCICYNNVEVCSDNIIKCGKVNHTICGSCKVQMKDDDCPMCRSHKIKQPVHQIIKIKIIQKPKKPSINSTAITPITPKQRRNFHRKHFYDEIFGPNTNRMVRQRSNRSGRYNQSNNWFIHQRLNDTSGVDESAFITREEVIRYNSTLPREEWLTREEVLRYNGTIRTIYDSESDSSEDSDSDTVSTLSLTDTEVAERIEELFED